MSIPTVISLDPDVAARSGFATPEWLSPNRTAHDRGPGVRMAVRKPSHYWRVRTRLPPTWATPQPPPACANPNHLISPRNAYQPNVIDPDIRRPAIGAWLRTQLARNLSA